MADAPEDPQPTTEPAGGEAPVAPTDRPAAGPNHRKLTTALILLIVVIAVTVFGVLSRENESNQVDDVSASLAAKAPLLSGPISATELQHTKCVALQGDQYRCTPVMDNALARNGVVVEWKNDQISKRLAGPTLAEAPRSGQAVAKAVAADEKATIGRTLKYGCAYSIALNPDGSSAASRAGGFRCAAPKPGGGKDEFIQRYVEFADDGAVTRDYMLP